MGWIDGFVLWKHSHEKHGSAELLCKLASAGAEAKSVEFRFTSWVDGSLFPLPVVLTCDGLAGIAQLRGPDQLSRFKEAALNWRRQGPDCFNEISGDFALALWDERCRKLVLARGPMSELPLAYSHGANATRFCSLAAALGSGTSPNLEWLGRQQAGPPVFGSRDTFFSGVSMVAPGTAVTFEHSAEECHRFFHARPLASSNAVETAAKLRLGLDQAVQDALDDDGSDAAAAHLSAGRDSGAVAATAAALLRRSGGKLFAYTAVPKLVSDRGPYDRMSDEGPGASAIAAMHQPTMDHRLISVSGADLGDLLDKRNAYLPGPYGTPANLPWWNRIQEAATSAGARSLLTGSAGNLTVSAGGPWALADLVAAGDAPGWLHAILKARRYPGSSWKNLLKESFSAQLPLALQSKLATLSRRRHPMPERGRFLREPLRGWMREMAARHVRRSVDGWMANRCRAIEENDGADPTGVILHNIVMRDPTAERKVIEASLALSPRDLASPYDERPVFTLAFADRLPQSTLRSAIRYYQGADWPTAIDRAALRQSLALYARSPAVAELLDLPAMFAALECWPVERAYNSAMSELITDQLLPAISVASFVHIHWP